MPTARYRNLLFVAAAILFLCLVFFGLSNSPSVVLSHRLPDGSLLRIVKISYGQDHYYQEPRPHPWQLAIGRKLPFWVGSKLGWWFDTRNWQAITNNPGISNLVLFTQIEEFGVAPLYRNLRIVASDNEGDSVAGEITGGNRGAVNSTSGAYHLLQLTAFNAFPRRDKTIQLRAFALDPANSNFLEVAQLRIPNPAFGSFPTWAPESLPDVKGVGDVTATLEDFVTDLSRRSPGKRAAEFEEKATRLRFSLAQDGSSNCFWRPIGLEVSDATGNRWLPSAVPGRAGADAAHTMTFPGALWPAPWKLRVELSGRDAIPAKETWSIEMPIPEQGAQTLDSHFCSFQVKPKPSQKTGTRSMTLTVNVDKIDDDGRLVLVKISDEQGRPARINQKSDWARHFCWFDLTVPADSTRLECAFAEYQSRFAEFIVTPRK